MAASRNPPDRTSPTARPLAHRARASIRPPLTQPAHRSHNPPDPRPWHLVGWMESFLRLPYIENLQSFALVRALFARSHGTNFSKIQFIYMTPWGHMSIDHLAPWRHHFPKIALCPWRHPFSQKIYFPKIPFPKKPISIPDPLGSYIY